MQAQLPRVLATLLSLTRPRSGQGDGKLRVLQSIVKLETGHEELNRLSVLQLQEAEAHALQRSVEQLAWLLRADDL